MRRDRMTIATLGLERARERMRVFLGASVEEPIAESHWRRAAKSLGWASVALVFSDLLMQVALSLGMYSESEARGYQPFLIGHATTNLFAVAACIWLLTRSRSEGERRVAMMTYLVAVSVAIAFALWVHGESSLNLAWYLVLIGSFRIFFDFRLGRWAFLCAIICYGVLILLQATGAVEVNPLQPDSAKSPQLLAQFVSAAIALLGAWTASHYVAIRIRTTEQELRQLNASLEQRVQREVAERSRDLAEAVLSLAKESHPIDPDQVVDGRYRTIRQRGQGGMGDVWEAERVSDGQRVALKVLRSQSDPLLVVRFAREAQIATTISHPNLVPVLDVILADGRLFLVMPLIETGSLDEHARHFGEPNWAMPLLAGIAKGLAALHERGVVHRDLKPANVLVAGTHARITDLGIARLMGHKSASSDSSELSHAHTAGSVPEPDSPTLLSDCDDLTRTGEILGTPHYMAPELVDNMTETGPPADVFAFGVIAYEALTGRKPYAEPPVVSRRLGRPITQPPMETMDAAHAILKRCLSLDPAQRPTSAEIALAIDRC